MPAQQMTWGRVGAVAGVAHDVHRTAGRSHCSGDAAGLVGGGRLGRDRIVHHEHLVGARFPRQAHQRRDHLGIRRRRVLRCSGRTDVGLHDDDVTALHEGAHAADRRHGALRVGRGGRARGDGEHVGGGRRAAGRTPGREHRAVPGAARASLVPAASARGQQRRPATREGGQLEEFRAREAFHDRGASSGASSGAAPRILPQRGIVALALRDCARDARCALASIASSAPGLGDRSAACRVMPCGWMRLQLRHRPEVAERRLPSVGRRLPRTPSRQDISMSIILLKIRAGQFGESTPERGIPWPNQPAEERLTDLSIGLLQTRSRRRPPLWPSLRRLRRIPVIALRPRRSRRSQQRPRLCRSRRRHRRRCGLRQTPPSPTWSRPWPRVDP